MNIFNEQIKYQETLLNFLRECEHNPLLMESIHSSRENTVFYNEQLTNNISDIIPNSHDTPTNPHLIFTNDLIKTSISMRNTKPNIQLGIAHFTNDVFPGGNIIRSASDSESQLCFGTTLYPCLNTKNLTPLCLKQSEHLISIKYVYIPNIIIMKNQDHSTSLLPQKHWFSVNIISNLLSSSEYDYLQTNQKNYFSNHKNRHFILEHLLFIARSHHLDALILPNKI